MGLSAYSQGVVMSQNKAFLAVKANICSNQKGADNLHSLDTVRNVSYKVPKDKSSFYPILLVGWFFDNVSSSPG